jgi:hypothetical protein
MNLLRFSEINLAVCGSCNPHTWEYGYTGLRAHIVPDLPCIWMRPKGSVLFLDAMFVGVPELIMSENINAEAIDPLNLFYIVLLLIQN